MTEREPVREDFGAHDGWLVRGDEVENLDAGAPAMLGANPNGETPGARRGAVEAGGEPPGMVFGRVDLGPIVRGDVPPVRPVRFCRVDGGCLLYPGGRHDIHGEPGSGKSMAAEVSVAEELVDVGRVVVLDYESTGAMFVERGVALGVAADVLCDPCRVAYFNPPRMDGRDVARFAETVAAFGATLIVVDAVGPAMARQGLDENVNADVARWHADFVEVVRAGVTLLLIDHVSRDSNARQRGGRGGWMKLQLLDVSYGVKKFKGFSRTEPGWLKLACAKDRFGTYAIGEVVAEVHVTPDDGLLDVEVRPPEETDRDGGDGWRPSWLMEQLSVALERREAAGENPPDRDETLACVKGKAVYKRQALDALVADGYFERTKDGRHYRYRSVRPFRELGDADEPPLPEEPSE